MVRGAGGGPEMAACPWRIKALSDGSTVHGALLEDPTEFADFLDFPTHIWYRYRGFYDGISRCLRQHSGSGGPVS